MNTPKLNPRRQGPHTRILQYDPIFAQKFLLKKDPFQESAKLKPKKQNKTKQKKTF